MQGSNDALAWTDILRVANPNYIDDRLLPAVSYRYLRLVDYVVAGLRGEEPNTLEPINEIEVYERGAEDFSGCAPPVYPSPLDRKAWTATSNNGASAQGAVSAPEQGWIDPHGSYDGPDHWLSQHLQVGSYLAIDMGSVQTFNQIYTSVDHDAVLDYNLYVSEDGVNWGTAISGGTAISTGGHAFAPFSFATQQKRYFKIESQYVADFPEREWGYWNVSALNAEEQTADNVNIAIGKPATGSAVKNPGAVFDGDDTTGTDDAGMIQVDLGKPTAIGSIKVKFAMTNGGFFYDIATSDDGTLWTQRQRVLAVRNFRHLATNLIATHYTSRFLRFAFMPSQPRDADVPQKVNEIEVYGIAAP